MKKIFLLIFLMLNISSLNAADTSISFLDRQVLLEKVKSVIKEEESIAKAYELYLISEYKKAKTLSTLIHENYLGTDFKISFSAPNNSYFNNYSLSQSDNYINYRLKTLLIKDTKIKDLYESDTFRKKTFFYDNKIYLLLNTNLAKSIYTLIQKQGEDLLACSDSSSKQYCIQNDVNNAYKTHIFIYRSTTKSASNIMMYYLPENFEKGPILIKDDISLHSRDEFKLIPIGSTLYDLKGVKYLKTKDDIQKVN